jgi:hypothetical protein
MFRSNSARVVQSGPMAEHRRVEPRGIAGSGMATDPDRIREIEEEYERRQRAWRDRPERRFDDVLEEAPPKAEEAEEAPKKELPKPAPKPGPRVPPDPREALLRKKLAEGQAQEPPKIAARGTHETPPTGSRPAKP